MTETPEDLYRGWTASQLRVLMQSGGLPPTMNNEAIKWLGDHERREEARISSAQAEQNRTARTAKNAAIVAAIAATITIPLAIIAIMVSVLAWRFPHH